ncbi:hypothetical protein B0T18DRAFT_490586 [Schizothecium vesticola]|uniref:Uncharacterized protein n=1 Tax=Schizothecium vesticola TaxID=314040 RepID=A0AA40K362_9PEZI|nr:hypothetical protein B0T18DRAFT_490586 [Schizothecium vesticola]
MALRASRLVPLMLTMLFCTVMIKLTLSVRKVRPSLSRAGAAAPAAEPGSGIAAAIKRLAEIVGKTKKLDEKPEPMSQKDKLSLTSTPADQRRFFIRTLSDAKDFANCGKACRLSDFCRVRVRRAHCHLEGLKLVHAGNLLAVCLHLRTSGRFYNRDLPGHEIKDAVPLWKAFVEDPRHLLFEYNLEDCSIICDGEHSFQRDYARRTPSWTGKWRLRRGVCW